MTGDTEHAENGTEPTAGHGPVDRPVGRPLPERAKLTPLQQRIVAALTVAPRQRLGYHDLALHLWPHETHPRAWRYSSTSGPHERTRNE